MARALQFRVRPAKIALPIFLAFALPVISLPAQEARVSNLSVRAQAGTAADTLITGFTVGPGLRKTVLIRAVGPTLGLFGVTGTLADPKLELYSGTAKIAENDNWNASDATTFTSVGAFALGANSKDAALVATLDPGSYTAQVSGLGAAASGVALVEVYEITGGATRLTNLSTRARVGIGTNILITGLTVAPGSAPRRLLLRAVGPGLTAFGVSGVLGDPKLELHSSAGKVAENDNWETAVGAAAADAAQLRTAISESGAFPLTAGSKDAALLVNLAPGGYTLQVSGVAATTGIALVELYDLTPPTATVSPNASLYIAQLRPESTATGSMAAGFATIVFNADGTRASVNVTFSNLTSAQTAARLRLGAAGDYVLNLPLGQVTSAQWTFAPSGIYTTADLINALNTGNISVGLDSARFPAGELRGTFIQSYGSRTFTPPAAPPALAANALTAPSQTAAARFLTQATFGPTFAEISALTAQGISAWIDAQLALPPTLHLLATRADAAAFPNPPAPPVPFASYEFIDRANRHAAWWKAAVTAPDQLRQRVAFALSEILVVSEADGTLNHAPEAMARYYDILVSHAFGSYRQMLDEVSLSPVMGFYLSHLRNQKGDPAKGTSPDENYAREVQQLFSIGLVQLQPDGSLLLDADGLPIPTYHQDMIVETAKVFTGWAYAASVTDFFALPPNFDLRGAADDSPWLVPMRYFDAYHDKTEKRVLSLQQRAPASATPTVIPAGQTGPQDLKLFLDALFNHPNTGPFIGRQLIQRLVTSNPSPAYVFRTAQVFADDGTGTRGNLGAVVRALLTDYEARSPGVVGHLGYGKVKEPLLRLTALFRAFNARAPNGRFLDGFVGEVAFNSYMPMGILAGPGPVFKQGPLAAPSVFNFFSPDYVVPGPLASAGLVAPELQITDATTAITTPNALREWILRPSGFTRTGTALPVPTPSPYLSLDYSSLTPLARTSGALVDRLNLLFCGNAMSAGTRSEILSALSAASPSDEEIVRTAVLLTVTSADSAVQK